MIRELRPAALDELGPAPAIEELAARTAARHGFEVRTRIELEGRLPAEVETALYRLTQEALNNVVKHARAASAAVRVTSAQRGLVHLEVADDGGGFDVDASAGGFGLPGMRERVELLGGELEISSSPDGTRLVAVLPVRA